MVKTRFFKGLLGPFRLLRRYTSRHQKPGEDPGRLYEAYNVLTENPALVLIPNEHTALEPQEEWRVRLRSQAQPPYLALEVEQAPPSGRLLQLHGMLSLLGTAVHQLEKDEEARAHLTRLPMGVLELLVHEVLRVLRWVRARPLLTFAVCAPVVLALLFVAILEQGRQVLENQARWEAERAVAEQVARSRAPTLVDKTDMGAVPLAYPLPGKPFSDQAKAPCKPKEGEVELNGGCWVELAKHPPCYENQAEYQGKCYLPVSARSRRPREPQSVQP